MRGYGEYTAYVMDNTLLAEADTIWLSYFVLLLYV